jgi:hypothetical protein
MSQRVTLKGPDGNVVIIDANENGILDEGDMIVGDDLASLLFHVFDKEAVMSRLASMGIEFSGFHGQQIAGLRQYVEEIKAARSWAKSGSDYAMNEHLERASRISTSSNIRVREQITASIRKECYDNAYAAMFADAERLASDNRIRSMIDRLEDIRRSSKRSGIPLDADRMRNVLRLAYDVGQREAMGGLPALSRNISDIYDMERCLIRLIEVAQCAKMAGMQPDTTVASKVIDFYSTHFAGSLQDMRFLVPSLKLVYECAQGYGLAFDYKLAFELRRRRLAKASDDEMKTAADEAERCLIRSEQWPTPAFTETLDNARSLAKRARVPFDEARASRIMKTGYTHAYERMMGDAEAEARNLTFFKWQLDVAHEPLESIQQTRVVLRYARDYARKAGVAFDEKRASQIMRDSYASISEFCMDEARKAASAGRADGPRSFHAYLKHAEEMARRGHLPFAKKDAEAIRKDACRMTYEGKLKSIASRKWDPVALHDLAEEALNCARGDDTGFGGGSAHRKDRRRASEQLEAAKKAAADGDVRTMERLLKRAGIPALRGTSEERVASQIMKDGYRNAHAKAMDRLDAYAAGVADGEMSMIENAGHLARHYAKKANISYDEVRIAALEEKGYARTCEEKMRAAEKLATSERIDDKYGCEVVFGSKCEYRTMKAVKMLLSDAERAAKRARIPFDERRAASIVKTYYESEYSMRLRRAEEAAFELDEDAPALLQGALRSAKAGGIEPDEKRVAHIKKLAAITA